MTSSNVEGRDTRIRRYEIVFLLTAGAITALLLITCSIPLTKTIGRWLDCDARVPITRASWRVLYPDEIRDTTKDCDAEYVGNMCPAKPENALLWKSPHSIDSKEHIARTPSTRNRRYWIGTEISPEMLRRAREASASVFVPGLAATDFRTFVDGRRVQMSDALLDPVYQLSEDLLNSNKGVSVAVEIHNIHNAVYPDIVSVFGKTGLWTPAGSDLRAYITILVLYVRPIASATIYLTLAITFFFIWCSDRKKLDFFVFAIFAITLFITEIVSTNSSRYVFQYSEQRNTPVMRMMLIFVESFMPVITGLAYGRYNRKFVCWLSTVLLGVAVLVPVALMNDVEFSTIVRQWVSATMSTGGYVAGGILCLARLCDLIWKRHRSFSVERIVGLGCVGCTMIIVAVIVRIDAATIADPQRLTILARLASPMLFVVMTAVLFAEYVRYMKRAEENALCLALAETAAQVAHDIRAPLATLEGVIDKRSGLNGDADSMMESAVVRIRDIANSLLGNNRDMLKAVDKSVWSDPQFHRQTVSSVLISRVVEEIVSQKRIEFRNRSNVQISCSISDSARSAYAGVDAVALQRVLSNLITNGVEAISDSGFVRVSLEVKQDTEMLITIEDSGCGVPAEVLSRIGDPGVSHGKAHGNGLGLRSAKFAVESWGGSFRVRAEKDKGSVICITLPVVVTAVGCDAVLIDNDMLVRLTWLNSGKTVGKRVLTFCSEEEFLAAVDAVAKTCTIYVDVELQNQVSGVDVARRLVLLGFPNVVLTTGHGVEHFKQYQFLKGVIGKTPPWML